MALNHSSEIKAAVGIGLAKNSSPIMVIRRFLEKIACKFLYLNSESCKISGKRIRVYQILIPEDRRKEVFYHWIKQDCDRPGSSLFWDKKQFKLLQSELQLEQNSNYLQLTLNL